MYILPRAVESGLFGCAAKKSSRARKPARGMNFSRSRHLEGGARARAGGISVAPQVMMASELEYIRTRWSAFSSLFSLTEP